MFSRRTWMLTAAASIVNGQNNKTGMFENAEAYESFMGRWSRQLATLLIQFARIPDDGRVLDVGSGTGQLAFEIARLKPAARITGIDPSKEYVSYANSRNRSPDRVSFEIGDAQTLRFPPASFTACSSLLVFNFIPDPAKALQELKRITQPGGTISAAVWDYGGGMEMLRAFWDAAVELDPSAAKRDEKNMPLCHQGQLGHLWKEGGLDPVDEQPLDFSMRYASFNDYWAPFLLGQGPAGVYVRSLSPERVQALREAVKKRLSVASETRSLTLPARAWAARGQVLPN
jgi:SAM-dependent methyltransferase